MFGFKKIAVVAAAAAALAVPSLALADNDDYGRRDRDRDDYAVQQLREEIRHDQFELRREVNEGRWAQARQERREIQRKRQELQEIFRARGDGYDRR